jgi:selenocysteine lyase/cysteine desulfurase
MSGIKFDLEAIGQKCYETGTLFIVDGTQSVGALPMDVKKFRINALVCAGYKWLMGPYSLALAYFDENFHEGKPLEESWMNRINAQEFSRLTQYEEEYMEGAGRFNVGETSNFILMPMLKASLAQIAEWKPENIQQYCKELIQPLLSCLKNLGVEPEEEAYFSNHLFALNLPKEIDREKLTQLLLQNNVYVSVRGEFLRISVNVFNDEKDIEKLIETIESARVDV